MLHNNTEVKLGKLSKTRKTDFLIKTKLEKQDEEVVGCVKFTIFKQVFYMKSGLKVKRRRKKG